MTRHDQIIYSAAFFDGEGNISITRQKAATSKHGFYYALRLTVAQVDPAPLRIYLALYGGTLKERPATQANHRDAWVWIASAGPGTKALRAMLPYLIIKRAEAELALEFQDRRTSRAGSFISPLAEERQADEDDFLIMKALKRIIY
jgi:hypothetical protein